MRITSPPDDHQVPIDFESARRLRDAGMKTAIDHADRISEHWSDRAYWIAEAYARLHSEFTGEQLRSYASAVGLELPPDGRAWGGVLNRLARSGLIRKGGYRNSTNPLAHCRPVTVWRTAA